MHKLNTFYPTTTLQMIVDWANENKIRIVQILYRTVDNRVNALSYIDVVYWEDQ